MYMGYVEYNIVYRRGPKDSELYSETRPFIDLHQLQMMTSIEAVDAMRELYGADEVHVVAVHTDGYETEGYVG